MPIKANKSTPQGSQMAGSLFGTYYDPVVKKIESLRIGIEFNIEQNKLKDILSFNNKEAENEIEFEFKINLNEISNKEFSIIICILLFCDDTTLIADCPFKMQRLIRCQEDGLKTLGMRMHPDKSQLIYIGKNNLNQKQKDYKIKIYNHKMKRYTDLNDCSSNGVKVLGVKFRISKDTKIDFNEHINYLCDNTERAINNLKIRGFNVYVDNIQMKREIFQSMIASKLLYGSRIFTLNKTMQKKIIKIESKYYKASIGAYISSDNVVIRIIFGLPSLIAIWDINILKEYWHIIIECQQQNNLLWMIFDTLYKRYCVETYNQVKNYKNNAYISKGYLFDVCWILNKYKLIKYWNILNLPKKKEEWDDIIQDSVYKYHYKKDLDYIKNKKYQIITPLLGLDKYNKYSVKFTEYIDSKLKYKNKKNKMLLSIIMNNMKVNWKNKNGLISKECFICDIKWDNPLKHLMNECEVLQDKFKAMKNVKRLKWEHVFILLETLVEREIDI